MYLEFYNLTDKPFLMIPDPDFMFWSEHHQMAYTMLLYGLSTKAPVTVITGEVGAGKTTLLRELLREAPDDVRIGLVSNMQAGRGELLHWVMIALDQDIRDEPYVVLFRRFQDYVIDVYSRGGRVVLIIDEAQNLSVDQLEELRMLSNINAEKDELLQIILVGQPELRATLKRPELRQFAQRICSDFHIGPLSEADTIKYIDHRLSAVDAKWRIFDEQASRAIYKASGGVPRLINILCDLCLVYGFADEKKVIRDDLIREFLDSARAKGIYDQFAPLGPGDDSASPARADSHAKIVTRS